MADPLHPRPGEVWERDRRRRRIDDVTVHTGTPIGWPRHMKSVRYSAPGDDCPAPRSFDFVTYTITNIGVPQRRGSTVEQWARWAQKATCIKEAP